MDLMFCRLRSLFRGNRHVVHRGGTAFCSTFGALLTRIQTRDDTTAVTCFRYRPSGKKGNSFSAFSQSVYRNKTPTHASKRASNEMCEKSRMAPADLASRNELFCSFVLFCRAHPILSHLCRRRRRRRHADLSLAGE